MNSANSDTVSSRAFIVEQKVAINLLNCVPLNVEGIEAPQAVENLLINWQARRYLIRWSLVFGSPNTWILRSGTPAAMRGASEITL